MGEVESALETSESSVEAKIAKAYILADSADQETRNQAYATYEELNERHSTWYVRHKLLQLLLLLQKTDVARKACTDWLVSSEGIEHFGDWERGSIDFVAGTLPSDAFVAQDSDRIGSFFVNYQRAFLAMGEGDRKAAWVHFQVAAEWHYPDERRQWARAFAERLSRELGVAGAQHGVH
jgi:hypothetical protein